MGFDKDLKRLLSEAQAGGVLGAEAAVALLKFHEGRKRPRGFSVVSAVFGGLGASAIILGVILVISANWPLIPAYAKIACFIALLVSVHGAALYLASVRPEYNKTRDALHFAGAGFVLAGIGLYAQIYNLSSSSGTAFLLWLVLILPLALTLRTSSLTFLCVAAFSLWYHFYTLSAMTPEAGFFLLRNEAVFAGFFLILNAALAKLDHDNRRGPWLYIVGAAALGVEYAILGFEHSMRLARHSTAYWPMDTPAAMLSTALLALVIIGGLFIALASLLRKKTSGMEGAGALLVVVMVLFVVAIPRLPMDGLAISIVSWALWFAGAFWLVLYGAWNGRQGLVNAGVWLSGLGIILRFLDLVSTMLRTGLSFIILGIALLIICFAVEKARRSLVKRLPANRHA